MVINRSKTTNENNQYADDDDVDPIKYLMQINQNKNRNMKINKEEEIQRFLTIQIENESNVELKQEQDIQVQPILEKQNIGQIQNDNHNIIRKDILKTQNKLSNLSFKSR